MVVIAGTDEISGRLGDGRGHRMSLLVRSNELTERFDGARLDDLRVPDEDIEAAAAAAPEALLAALHEAAARIRAFAGHQGIMPWRDTIGGATVARPSSPSGGPGCTSPGAGPPTRRPS